MHRELLTSSFFTIKCKIRLYYILYKNIIFLFKIFLYLVWAENTFHHLINLSHFCFSQKFLIVSLSHKSLLVLIFHIDLSNAAPFVFSNCSSVDHEVYQPEVRCAMWGYCSCEETWNWERSDDSVACNVFPQHGISKRPKFHWWNWLFAVPETVWWLWWVRR